MNCTDLINDYSCLCPANFDGKNCSIVLTNCSEYNPCENSATCYYNGSDLTCTCSKGFTGQFCSNNTNVNLNGNGYWKLSESQLGGVASGGGSFVISLAFATTLSNGRIFHISFTNNSSLDVYMEGVMVSILIAGKKYCGESTSDQYNSGKWHNLTINISQSGCSVKFDEGIIHSIQFFTYHGVQNIYIGGMPNNSQFSNYTGCIRDVKIGSGAMIPSTGVEGNAVSDTCGRKSVCNASSCNRAGNCIDNWTANDCECFRQYFGDNCESGKLTNLNFDYLF